MDGTGDEGFDIDGSVLEGGGQILRISVALGVLTGRPIRIHKIRAGRGSAGLGNQHMQGIDLVNRICNGKLVGCALKSQEISLTPGKVTGGEYVADARAAGFVRT